MYSKFLTVCQVNNSLNIMSFAGGFFFVSPRRNTFTILCNLTKSCWRWSSLLNWPMCVPYWTVLRIPSICISLSSIVPSTFSDLVRKSTKSSQKMFSNEVKIFIKNRKNFKMKKILLNWMPGVISESASLFRRVWIILSRNDGIPFFKWSNKLILSASTLMKCN